MTTWAKTIEISKADDEKRLIFGWASVAEFNGIPLVDSQDDVVPIDELEKAVYPFVRNVRAIGKMHEEFEGIGTLVESCVFTREKYTKMFGDTDTSQLPVGWWIGVKVESDEVWKSVKSGRLRAFSIGGSGKRVEE